MKYFWFVLVLIVISGSAFGQDESTFELKGEYRFNPLYSHGFRVPLQNDASPEFYVHMRTRVILDYKNPGNLSSQLIIQDRRAWGTYNNNGAAGILSIFRGWVEKSIGNNFSVKLGRQGFIYDDQFILGSLNWGGNMAHDAALLKLEPGDWKIHGALSYNANGFNLSREPFNFDNHKHMQFLWINRKFNRSRFSFIFMNRGLEKPDGSLRTRSQQTIGGNLKFSISEKVGLKTIYYYQFGKDTVGENAHTVDAFLYSVQLDYQPATNISFTLGADVVSGTNMSDLRDPTFTKKNNFDILYGLRHGHFGYLDYFYLVLWPETGLEDYYLKSKLKFTDKINLDTHLHLFNSEGEMLNSSNEVLDSYYGTELDLKLNYKHDSLTKVTLAFSQIWLTDTFLSYYSEQPSQGSYAIYAVATFSPTFFSTVFDK